MMIHPYNNDIYGFFKQTICDMISAMKRKVERIANDLAGRLKEWDSVDTITIAEWADMDIYDPYFFLSLDVYYQGKIPSAEKRRKLFSDAGAFETSSVTKKDRFLLEDLPVRVEFKDISRIDNILLSTKEHLWVFRQTGTYMFYRIEKGKVLNKKSDWIDRTKEKLKNLPEVFWKMLHTACQSTMEHYLLDLNAAVARADNFFYLVSSAGFIKNLCSMLFILNRRFEPSGRKLFESVLELPRKPDNFRGRFESFLRQAPELTPVRKREVAELLAKSVIAMD